MKYGAKSNKQAGANQPGQEGCGRKTKTKSNNLHIPNRYEFPEQEPKNSLSGNRLLEEEQ